MHRLRTVALLLTLVAATPGQGHFLPINEALLGVVTVPADGPGARIAHVVQTSPAARAGLAPGDVILRIAGEAIDGPRGLDRVLAASYPGQAVEIASRRKAQVRTVEATLAWRRHFEGPELRPRERGAVGFAAAPWIAHSWTGVARGAEPPRLDALRGKVVVIHAFQGG